MRPGERHRAEECKDVRLDARQRRVLVAHGAADVLPQQKDAAERRNDLGAHIVLHVHPRDGRRQHFEREHGTPRR